VPHPTRDNGQLRAAGDAIEATLISIDSDDAVAFPDQGIDKQASHR
jgi:hypothetical protein